MTRRPSLSLRLATVVALATCMGSLAQPAPAPAQPAASPVPPTLYQQTLRYLDQGGDVLFYLNAEGVAARWTGMLTNMVSSLPPGPESANIQRRVASLEAFLRSTGLHDIRAVGFSSRRRADGLNDLRSHLVRTPSTSRTTLWGILGTQPRNLRFAAYVPEDAAMTLISTTDLSVLWQLIERGVREVGEKEGTEGWNKALKSFAQMNGFELQDLVKGLGDEMMFSLQLDTTRTTQLPGPKPTVIAEPSLLLGFTLRSEAPYDVILRKLQKPGQTPTTSEVAGGSMVQFAPVEGAPLPIQLTLWRKGDLLLLASSPAVMSKALAAATGKGGLLASREFKQLWPTALPACNSMTYTSKRLYDTILQLQTMNVPPQQQAPQKAFMEKMQAMFQSGPSFSLTVCLPEGNRTHTVSTTGGREIVASLAVMPVGLMAAIAIPSFVKARTVSQKNACLNNLRMLSGAKDQYALDHNAIAPASISELIPTYLHRPMVCPQGGRYELGALGTDPECSMGMMGHTI